MNDFANKIFGSLAAQYLPRVDTLIASFSGTHYHFIDPENYKQILHTNPNEAGRIYWTEILARAHIAAVATILRSRHWIQGVIGATEDANFLSFAACMRGVIESAADSHDALHPVPRTLARDHSQIITVLEYRAGKTVLLAPEMEDMLIHFSHARKLKKDEDAPQSHKAKTVSDYLTILEISEVPQVRDCYSFLCDVTHPGATSVWAWFESIDESQFRLSPNRDSTLICQFSSDFQEIMLPLFMFAFNPAILTLAVLNYFPLEEFHCGEVAGWDLTGIVAWRKIQKDLKGAHLRVPVGNQS